MIILDSNVLSEFLYQQPSPVVLRWANQYRYHQIWTTSINIFEIQYGIEILPPGKRRVRIQSGFNRFKSQMIGNRVLSLDESAALAAADLSAICKAKGKPQDFRDSMIAGIVLANKAKLATRNTKHFAEIAKHVINPWAA